MARTPHPRKAKTAALQALKGPAAEANTAKKRTPAKPKSPTKPTSAGVKKSTPKKAATATAGKRGRPSGSGKKASTADAEKPVTDLKGFDKFTKNPEKYYDELIESTDPHLLAEAERHNKARKAAGKKSPPKKGSSTAVTKRSRSTGSDKSASSVAGKRMSPGKSGAFLSFDELQHPPGGSSSKPLVMSSGPRGTHGRITLESDGVKTVDRAMTAKELKGSKTTLEDKNDKTMKAYDQRVKAHHDHMKKANDHMMKAYDYMSEGPGDVTRAITESRGRSKSPAKALSPGKALSKVKKHSTR